MIVYSIIGPCGAGKTTMLSMLPGSLRTHKEGYVQKDADTVPIDNRTYLSKLRYVSAWYLEMIKLKSERNRKIVSDRCPYDVCAYVDDQQMQHAIIRAYMHELKDHFDVDVRTIYLRVPFDLAKKRVADRLIREPWRKTYHEDDERFQRKTWQYYEDHVTEWSYIVENHMALEDGLARLVKIVGR